LDWFKTLKDDYFKKKVLRLDCLKYLKPYLLSNDKKLIALTLVLLSSICERNEFGQKYLGEKGILKNLLELIKNTKDKNLSVSMFNLLRILSEYRKKNKFTKLRRKLGVYWKCGIHSLFNHTYAK
jgi:hypothetical protein